MPLDWTTGDLMVPAGCLPCCVPSTPIPTECACALLIPPFASPYADYATAEAAIADQTDGCVAYADFGGGDTALSIAASFDGTTITADAHTELASPSLSLRVDAYFSVALLSGAELSIPFTLTTDGTAEGSAALLDCATGAELATDTIASGSGTLSLTAPDSGTYALRVRGLGAFGMVTSVDMDFTVTCDMDYWVNPVIALWDDSGTTRQLEACPKLYLPPLTESTGDWYVDCAEADDTIAVHISNCVGYFNVDITDTNLYCEATDGGSSLTFLYSVVGPLFIIDPRFTGYGSINLSAGDVLSAAFSYSGDHGFPVAGARLYDYDGNEIEALSGTGGTLTFSAAPYTGRYIVLVSGGRNDGVEEDEFSVTVLLTSSGDFSVNEIQALYDVGLTCAGRLNCGDACP